MFFLKWFGFNKKPKVSEDIFQEVEEIETDNFCDNCNICNEKDKCTLNQVKNYYLRETFENINLDPKKDTILLIDDNSGVLSFLLDDLKYLKSKAQFDYTKYNLLMLDGNMAAFKLRSLINSGLILNIKYAIIDITLGGTLIKNNKNITLDGVDVYIDIIKEYPDLLFFFYTGNKLNPYIKTNEQILNKFKEISSKEIDEFLLFKTKLTRDERQEYILNFLRKGL